MKTLVNGTEEVVSFNSPEAIRGLRDLRKRVLDLKAARDAAQRSLSLCQRNPEVLELQGKSSIEAIRAATLEFQSADSKLSGAKSELSSAILAERQDFDAVRGKLLNELHQGTIAPSLAQFRQIIQQVEATIDGLIAKIQSIELSTKANGLDLDTFDCQLILWNKLVTELGGPSNALIDDSNAVQISAAQSFLSVAKDAAKITSSVTRLQNAVSAARSRISGSSRRGAK
jgi:hypothetical protein